MAVPTGESILCHSDDEENALTTAPLNLQFFRELLDLYMHSRVRAGGGGGCKYYFIYKS